MDYILCTCKTTGTADRRLEEIQRLSAEREAGVVCGN